MIISILKRSFVLLCLIHSVQFSFGTQFSNNSSKSLFHLIIATQDFEQNKDQIKFELCKNQIKEYYNSGTYDTETAHICAEAKYYFNKLTVTEKSLVIFDVDDTAVYAHAEWKLKNLGIHTPVPRAIAPVLDLYKFLIGKGFKVIFITGRDTSQYDDTKKELKSVGYQGFMDLLCIPQELLRGDGRENLAQWKCKTRESLSQLYDIVGSVADRDLDFAGGYSGYIVKLPNWVY